LFDNLFVLTFQIPISNENTASEQERMAPTTKEGENELSYIDELRLERRMRQSGIAAADDDDDDDGGIAAGQRTYTNREAYARFSATPSAAFAEFLDMEADDTLFDNHRMRLYDRPMQRQLWGSPVMDVDIGWNTLFFDLFYVAAAYNLGNLLMSGMDEDNYDHTFLNVLGIYGGLYDIFLRASLYDSQFSSRDYAHRIVELMRIFCLSMVVAHINSIESLTDPIYRDTYMITLWFFLELLIRSVLELELYFLTKGDQIAIKNQSKRHLLMEILPVSVFYLAATIIAAGLHHEAYDAYKNAADVLDDVNDSDPGHTTAVVEEHHRFLVSKHELPEMEWDAFWNDKVNQPIILLIFGVMYSHLTMGVTSLVLSPKPNIRSLIVPMNIDFLIHRFGEFTMIFFGEAIMGLLIVNSAETKYYHIPLALGVLSIMILQNFKYESEPHGENHYLWGGGLRALCVYSILTELLCLFMIGLAIAYKSMLISIAFKENEDIALYKEETAGSPEHRRLNAGGPQMQPFASEAMFSTSLAIILAIIVVMSYSHIGFKKMIFPIRHGRLHYSSLLRLFIQLGLILFVGTMFLWDIEETEPEEPEYFFKYIIGFVVILIFALFKAIENLIATKKNTEKIISNLQTFGKVQLNAPSNNDDDDNVGSPFLISKKNTTNSNNDDDVGSPSLTNDNDDDLQSSTLDEASKRKSDDNKDSADDNRSLNDLEQEQKDLLRRAEHIAHLIDTRKDSARVEE